MTDVLGSLLMRESLDHCVKCTICETFCPVSNVTPLFPGPKYVGPQAERFRVGGEPSPDASLAGASSWKEKSGDGISLASGYQAAELIRGSRAGGWAAAPAGAVSA